MINYQILAECIRASQPGINGAADRSRNAWTLYDAVMNEARERERKQMQS